MKVLKAIANFFKNKKVQIWAGIMVGVIVVAFGIMSWIMIADKIEFAKISSGDGIFDFVPNLSYVDTITITNENNDLTADTVQLNNNMIGGVEDPVILKSEAKAVKEIMKRLSKGRKTNSFLQFFTGGASGTERLVSSYTSNSSFEAASKGVYVKIVFATAQFVLNRDDNTKPWHIEEFDPNYNRHTDENGQLYGQIVRHYNSSVINAIYIPLGGVKNSFTQQTWYLSIGSKEINNTTSLGYKFTTYGNYSSLLRYVKNIDDEFLLQ